MLADRGHKKAAIPGPDHKDQVHTGGQSVRRYYQAGRDGGHDHWGDGDLLVMYDAKLCAIREASHGHSQFVGLEKLSTSSGVMFL